MTKLVIFVGRTCERFLFCAPLSLDEEIEARICLQCFKVKRDEKKKLKSGPMAVNMSKVGFLDAAMISLLSECLKHVISVVV
jgi:hypothetical protein